MRTERHSMHRFSVGDPRTMSNGTSLTLTTELLALPRSGPPHPVDSSASLRLASSKLVVERLSLSARQAQPVGRYRFRS
ncbi:hypothetical protein RSOLAG1IB_10597 [Rhizoctonia solani AG-1 IB]|uniref:Uncharacterized protein n=1 Tax=Thanatephorus cucumeris (strain AG1-IB / isolate 7/3/14) TaxID=1108050 RepID=A0A0B7G364_THACB|nr:hypothetical protein RSOLAG1IB_10597 [Rhizoctonia solani AG-1 IB]